MEHDTLNAALYDADELLYKVCRVCEQETGVTGELQVSSDVDSIHRMIEQEIQLCKERLQVDAVHFALSDKDGYFRRDIYPPYKRNRKDVRKPLGFWKTRDWLVQEFVTYDWELLEADDVMGILTTEYEVIVSSDKDMKTVPGTFYSPYHDRRYTSSPEQADWYFLYQTLMGDSTDGFPGCPGIGAKKAERILNDIVRIPGTINPDEFDSCWGSVVETYEKAKKREDPVKQAICARILRPGEGGPKTIKLWEPPF